MSILEIFALAVIALHAAALAIINTTRTPEPGTAWAKVYRVIEVAAGLLSPLAKMAAVTAVGTTNGNGNHAPPKP